MMKRASIYFIWLPRSGGRVHCKDTQDLIETACRDVGEVADRVIIEQIVNEKMAILRRVARDEGYRLVAMGDWNDLAVAPLSLSDPEVRLRCTPRE